VNFNSLSPGEQVEISLQPEWLRRLDAWRGLLARCTLKPSRKNVHALRSQTLRLRVALQQRLQEQGADCAAADAFLRWNKEGKRLRRVLEPVRDADVYMVRLSSLRSRLQGTEDGATQPNPRCLREISQLEGRLKRQRQRGIGELVAVIEDRGKRLNRSSKELETALTPHMPIWVHSTAPEALRIFAELTGELPNLNAGNLHEYRKRLKQARYLAESSATADPLAKRLAAAFRRIHYAAGEWHDWQELARKTNRILPGHGKQDGLLRVLEALAEKALHRALGQCRRCTARLLKNGGETRPLPPRKPVVSETGLQFDSESHKVRISR
jgi:CHAD domain-containing protein